MLQGLGLGVLGPGLWFWGLGFRVSRVLVEVAGV